MAKNARYPRRRGSSRGYRYTLRKTRSRSSISRRFSERESLCLCRIPARTEVPFPPRRSFPAPTASPFSSLKNRVLPFLYNFRSKNGFLRTGSSAGLLSYSRSSNKPSTPYLFTLPSLPLLICHVSTRLIET